MCETLRSDLGGLAGLVRMLRAVEGDLAGATRPGKGDPRFGAFHEPYFIQSRTNFI